MGFFKFIPGFRSRVLWKSIVASIYYFLSIYFFIQSWGMLMFLFASPFAFFSFIDVVGISAIGFGYPANKYILVVSCILMTVGGIGVYYSFFNTKLIKKTSVFTNLAEDDLKVCFFSIGQGDCILIQQLDKNVLIDAGYKRTGKPIIRHLKRNGIEKLDYVIATHPHPDHIGGMPRVLKNIDVKNIIMPSKYIFSSKRHQKNNDKLIDIIREENINIIKARPGDRFIIGDSYLEILAPNGNDYNRVNNYSIVTKLVYKKTSFLFTGDAEVNSEREILSKGLDVSADVIKVGHHGSCTSSCEKFIKAVRPKYAVISVGCNSFYGQPDKCVLDRLSRVRAKLYRTDKQGTIVAISDGKDILFNVDNCPYPKTKFNYTSIRKKYRALGKNEN
jgi:competence protein ComEC